MGKETIAESFRNWVAGIGWALFLWGSQIMEEEYWRRIAQQEADYNQARARFEVQRGRVEQRIAEARERMQ